jgi:hypothetical protein
MTRFIVLALCFAASGCATPTIGIADPNSGQVVASCGGGYSGFLLGGLTGMAIEQSIDRHCADRYRDAGWHLEEQ